MKNHRIKKKRKKYYYKVVTPDLCSIIKEQSHYFNKTESPAIQYKIGEWVLSPEWMTKDGCHLFVFKNKKDATFFAFFTKKPRKVFKCEVKEICHHLPRPLEVKKLFNKERIFNFRSWYPDGKEI